MIAYRIANGVCIEVRFVPHDYVAGADETVVEGDVLPSRESLSDPQAWAACAVAPSKTLSDGELAALLVSKGILSQADVTAAAVTP